MSTAKTDTSTKTEVRLVIDGKSCTAHEGETVLDAARRAGIEIPALCQMEDTAPWGACRLCLVEVEGVAKLQAACTTWVGEGLGVRALGAERSTEGQTGDEGGFHGASRGADRGRDGRHGQPGRP